MPRLSELPLARIGLAVALATGSSHAAFCTPRRVTASPPGGGASQPSFIADHSHVDIVAEHSVILGIDVAFNGVNVSSNELRRSFPLPRPVTVAGVYGSASFRKSCAGEAQSLATVWGTTPQGEMELLVSVNQKAGPGTVWVARPFARPVKLSAVEVRFQNDGCTPSSFEFQLVLDLVPAAEPPWPGPQPFPLR